MKISPCRDRASFVKRGSDGGDAILERAEVGKKEEVKVMKMGSIYPMSLVQPSLLWKKLHRWLKE
jgi:hypothetical protein